MAEPAAQHEPEQTTPAPVAARKVEVPEWEHANVTAEDAAQSETRKSPQVTLSERFDAVMPPQRKYLRMRRRVFLLVLLGVFLAVLALIIGLAVGLTRRSHNGQDLPLPSNTRTFTGDLTYFEPGLGACGETDTSSDYIVAVSEKLFDAAGSSSSRGGNSNFNPLCNKMLRAERYDAEFGGVRSVDLKVVDRCVGCAVDDLDTTESAFEKLAPIASGRVDVTWAWLQPVATGS